MRRKFFGDRSEHPFERRFGRRMGFLAMGLLILAGLAAAGWLVMLLWNWLMPGLFAGVNQIDYWHALGLLLLCKILFGFRGRGGFDCGYGRRKRWENMSPEEREQLKAQIKTRIKAQFGGEWSPFDSDSSENPPRDAR